ncbi:hypothetical protein OSR52_16205, partial [Galbibacter sp. CMA-7]|nr:hypothetical protein [Galbibacter pacificus]MDG3587408.1 hypothetical protein [Galbibacter pacificus]
LSGNELKITNNPSATPIDLSGYISSDDQNLESATLGTDNILSLGIEDGTGVTVDLSPLDESAEVMALDVRVTANANGIADNATDITANANSIATNTTNITGNATNIDANKTAIESNDADIAANATAISDHIAADSDLDDKNELQDLSISGNTLTIEGGNSVTLPSADGTETKINAGTDMSITGTGTVADPYVVNSTFTEVDGSTSNETVTGLSFDGSVITLSEGGNTDKTVDISGVSTDDQTASEVSFTPTADVASNNVQGAIEEVQADLNLAKSQANTSISNLQTEIDANETAISNHITADKDIDVSNELQDLSLSGNILTLSTPKTSGNQVDLASINTDDQNASEVEIESDVDGDGIAETNVDDAINTITKVTSKAARIFYPPSIAIDASIVSPVNTKDLYKEYVDQYGMTITSSAKSSSAPAKIPTYTKTELYYYVTYYDPAVFENVSINDNGVMTYGIKAVPTDYNTLINVVFVVK